MKKKKKFSFLEHFNNHPELYGHKPLPSGKNIDGGPAVDYEKEFKERLAERRGMSFGSEAKFKK